MDVAVILQRGSFFLPAALTDTVFNAPMCSCSYLSSCHDCNLH